MSWKDGFVKPFKNSAISWFDLVVITVILVGGAIYLHDCLYWGIGWIGTAQYGDAEFWWNGALHVARGIFQDNPGKGFRPGYFILTGSTLPVLGQQFQQFYPYLVLVFLSVANFFYLSLRQTLPRWIAACVVAMLVFNPYTAEWVATSTTDSTGLILNMLALCCLMRSVNQQYQRQWLIAFAIFFALATLTRPLMTLFLGVVVFTLLLTSRLSRKQKLMTLFYVLAAFCLPTILWMSVQKFTIGRWAVSSNDASAFYAASDPAIQVWNNEMYDQIKAIAAKENHIAPDKVDDRLLNQTFWHETVKNYFKYPSYHLKRVLPHVVEIAKFTPKLATHGSDAWRLFFMELISIGLAISLWFKKRHKQALILIALSIAVYKYPLLIMCLTLVGAIIALFKQKEGPGIFLLSMYWLVGIFALYLVGGTFGPPSFSPQFALNALGYRLGSQVFFVGDILAAYCLVCLASKAVSNQTHTMFKFMTQPRALASGIVGGFYLALMLSVIVVYVIGGMTVMQRHYALEHAQSETYPELSPLVQFYQQHSGHQLIIGHGQHGGLNESIFDIKQVKSGVADVVFTGTISSFIWNMPGQPRAQIMTHTQAAMKPYTLGPGFVFLDIPKHINESEWIGKQGAFIIRPVPDHHNVSNQAYYLTTPSVRAFVPLADDGKQYDLKHVVWFPLIKNATQLESSGELQFADTMVTWAPDSGPAPYQRRFFIVPKTQKANGATKLVLNVSSVKGPAKLSFAYALGVKPGEPTDVLDHEYDLLITKDVRATASRQQIVSQQTITSLEAKQQTIKQIEIPVSANTRNIEISFNNIAPGTGIWIYEFNLSASDFVQHAIKSSATQRGV